MKKVVAAASWLALLSGTALAADLSSAYSSRTLQAAHNWTGFYVGGTVMSVKGSVWGQGFDASTNGFAAALQAGVNYQLPNNWVLGAEALVPVTFIDKTIGSVRGGVDYIVNVNGRVGYAFNRFLPYALVGVNLTRARTDFIGTDATGAPAPGVTTKVHANFSGYNLGAGLEYAVTQNWSVRGQYMMTKLSDATAVTPWNFAYTREARFHSFQFGVNYRF
jgi:opacity protein-like surface antigen